MKLNYGCVDAKDFRCLLNRWDFIHQASERIQFNKPFLNIDGKEALLRDPWLDYEKEKGGRIHRCPSNVNRRPKRNHCKVGQDHDTCEKGEDGTAYGDGNVRITSNTRWGP